MGRENRRNYYRIMHVQADAPVEIIRSSYRTLMQRLKMHPDLGGDHWDAALINEAYAVLSDPDKRADYDRQLSDYERQAESAVMEDTLDPRTPAGRPVSPVAANRCPFCKQDHHHMQNIDADQLCSACASPLCPAEPPNHETSWMRAVDRFPQDQLITFFTRWPQPEAHSGQLLDISVTGMQFETEHQVARHQFLKIQCDVCSTIARVAHCRPKPGQSESVWLVGVEFFTLRFERLRGAFVSAEA
jgi:hypothetical protein